MLGDLQQLVMTNDSFKRSSTPFWSSHVVNTHINTFIYTMEIKSSDIIPIVLWNLSGRNMSFKNGSIFINF